MTPPVLGGSVERALLAHHDETGADVAAAIDSRGLSCYS